MGRGKGYPPMTPIGIGSRVTHIHDGTTGTLEGVRLIGDTLYGLIKWDMRAYNEQNQESLRTLDSGEFPDYPTDLHPMHTIKATH